MITKKGSELDLLSGVNSPNGENSIRILSQAHFEKQNGRAYATPQRIISKSNVYVPIPFLTFWRIEIKI